MQNKRKVILAVLFLLSVINYSRIQKTDDIRLVEFFSVLAIGALAALLVQELFSRRK